MTRTEPKLHARARATILVVAAALALAGCAGDLKDPERFGPVPLCRESIDVEALLRARCGSAVCHGDGASPAAELDLVTPEVASRLVGVSSTQCEGQLRIDPDSPDQSFLLAKLVDPPSGCGSRMPLVGYLTEAEVACVWEWIQEVASTTPVVDAGVDAAVDAGSDAGMSDAGAMDGGP